MESKFRGNRVFTNRPLFSPTINVYRVQLERRCLLDNQTRVHTNEPHRNSNEPVSKQARTGNSSIT